MQVKKIYLTFTFVNVFVLVCFVEQLANGAVMQHLTTLTATMLAVSRD